VTRLVLARHGETEWNSDTVYRGRADIGLSAAGRLQAELLAARFAGRELAFLGSSPLLRAHDTAVAIAASTGTELQVVDELTDLDCGAWQGLSDSQVKERYPELRRRWRTAPHTVTLPGGESLGDVEARVAALLDRVLQMDGTILLVSHRVVLKVTICRLLGLGNSHFWDIRVDLAGITEFECSPARTVLVRHNDVSHLSQSNGAATADF
jgi:broad specificity phosphatase PhoE